jgi:hypothetical protein
VAPGSKGTLVRRLVYISLIWGLVVTAQAQDDPPLLASASRRDPLAEGSLSVLMERPASREDERPLSVASLELSREDDSAGPSAFSTRRSPWVGVESLTPPFLGQRALPEAQPANIPPWDIFQRRFRWEVRPDEGAYWGHYLFYCPPRREDPFTVAMKRLLQRKFYSEARRFMRRSWKKEFEAQPTMGYFHYLDGISKINHMGKDPSEYDRSNLDYYEARFRENLFRRGARDGERDFEIFAWGPFVVMDSGSLRLDLGRAVDFDFKEKVEIEEDVRAAPLLATRKYKLHTSVKLGLDIKEPLRREDLTWILKRYGVRFRMDWFSDVLGREMFSTELEVEFERDGEFAVMLNLVLNRWK